MDPLLQEQGCTPDRTHKGYCGLNPGRGRALPAAYQYFPNPMVGGALQQADYCPYFRGYSNRDCRDEMQTHTPERQNFGGEIYSPSSRCLESSLQLESPIDRMQGGGQTIGCYKTECLKNTNMDPAKAAVKISALVTTQPGYPLSRDLKQKTVHAHGVERPMSSESSLATILLTASCDG